MSNRKRKVIDNRNSTKDLLQIFVKIFDNKYKFTGNTFANRGSGDCLFYINNVKVIEFNEFPEKFIGFFIYDFNIKQMCIENKRLLSNNEIINLIR